MRTYNGHFSQRPKVVLYAVSDLSSSSTYIMRMLAVDVNGVSAVSVYHSTSARILESELTIASLCFIISPHLYIMYL